MLRKIPKLVSDAGTNHLKKTKRFLRKVRGAIAAAKLSVDDQNLFLALLGIGGHAERLLWSDCHAVRRAAKILARLMRAERKAHPKRTYYMATFFDDAGTTSDRTPFVKLTQLEAKIRRALMGESLNAFVMLEVHPLMNYPNGGEGRSLLFHGHAIVWSDEAFDHRAAESRFNTSRAWSCALGAPPVRIRPIGDAPGEIDRVAYYLIKEPHSAKNRMPDHKRPGGYILMDTTVGYRDELALRLFEGMSQVELTSLMFGVGEGAALRQRLRHSLETWHKSRPKTGVFVPANTDIWTLWHRVRQTFRSSNYLPYRFN